MSPEIQELFDNLAASVDRRFNDLHKRIDDLAAPRPMLEAKRDQKVAQVDTAIADLGNRIKAIEEMPAPDHGIPKMASDMVTRLTKHDARLTATEVGGNQIRARLEKLEATAKSLAEKESARHDAEQQAPVTGRKK